MAYDESMRRLLGLIDVAMTVGCGVASYHWYDKHHVSADLRRTITAALDASATDSDIRTYTRDARLQVHTTKDAALLSEFEQVVELGNRIDEMKRDTESDDSLNAMRERLGPGSSFDKLVVIKSNYVQHGQAVPKEVTDTLNQILSDEKKRSAERTQDVANEYKEMQVDSEKAIRFVADIRRQLQLPSLKSGK
jgi:hypothetical protein